ncbi:hypothetical protein [Maritimibacter sp. HL-12]|uniref:hypothetical protein n=1 Tax=Maritimibacter sp. HL-12 TaxID=1162418 RepID=UPI000A0F0642|nr:hypothetical protein [Maritimibacter sp. HL-12]SMH33864.1 hypothetical protein SAMN05661107_0470 [Maritimibacter sp. HL-12]
MTHRMPVYALVAALAFAPAFALADDDAPQPNPQVSEGAQMLSEGMRLLLRGLMDESEEGWSKLTDWLGDLSQFQPPERLPNGDIIIRRKPMAEPETGETDI